MSKFTMASHLGLLLSLALAFSASAVALKSGSSSTGGSIPPPTPLRVQWSQFRCNAEHTGETEGFAPSEHAYVLWRRDTTNEIHASPVAVGSYVLVGSYTGILHSVEMSNGERGGKGKERKER